MAKLVVHGKEGAQREILLGQQRVSIGRRNDNDVCFDDKATSSQHAVIITIGKNSYLQDLKSTNGTLVNGTPVQKHTLKHGDVILIGRNHLSYVDEPDSKPAPILPPIANVSNAKPSGMQPEPVNPEATLNQKIEQESRYEPWAERVTENAPPKTMVDNMLDAIRSHRELERTLQTRKQESLDQEWKKLIEAAQALKKRVAGHPQVKFFDISRQQDEIMIRIQRGGEKTGQHAILISRQHPHNPSPHETIWLLESGNPDKRFETCEDIMRNVMSTLAPLIA
ncbi:MAG: FHA domain-containing protein [Nevskiales bacterium]